MTALLDVNLLIALTWREHVLHGAAQRWFGAHGRAGWATTAHTEAGFLRLSMNPRVTGGGVSWSAGLRMLDAFRAQPGHERWAEEVDLAGSTLARRAPVIGFRQVADIHLAATAASHGARLATFDRGVLDGLHPDDRDVVLVVPG